MFIKVRGGRHRLALLAAVLVTTAGTAAAAAPSGVPTARVAASPSQRPAPGAPRNNAHPSRPATRGPGGAARRADQQRAASDAVRARAAREPVPAGATASFQVSPAAQRFLAEGLGLPVGSALLTGLAPDPTGGTLRLRLDGPPRPALRLPDGAATPAFGPTTLVADPSAGTLTVTASGPDASLTVHIGHAGTATAADIAGTVTLRVPVLGVPVPLSGALVYSTGAAGVSLTGTLPRDTVLRDGVATLRAGTTVRLTTTDGLSVTGPADLGPAAHRLTVTVDGQVNHPDAWSLAVRSVVAPTAAPLPGLALDTALSGTLTRAGAEVRYDVRGTLAHPWRPVPGVSLAGTVRYANTPPVDRTLAAPGLTATTPWLDVTGDLTVDTAAAGTLAAHGTLATNLATGAAALDARQTGALLLHATPVRTTLADATLAGRLTLGADAMTGTLGGTGVVAAVPTTGRTVLAPATLRLDHGVLAASYTMDSPAVAAPRVRAAATGTASTTYTLSAAAYAFLAGKLGLPLGGSATLTGTLSGQRLTLTVGAPGPLPLSLPTGIPAPVFGTTTITIDESTDTLTLDTTATAGVTAALHLTVAHASGTTLADGTDLSSTLSLGNVPFVGGGTITLTGALSYTGGTLGASLSGSLATALPLAGGAVTLQAGAGLSIATGTGLRITGTALLGPGASGYTIAVDGTLTDLSTWSLGVTTTAGQAWQPLPGLTVYPSFSATIADRAGTVSFDLSSTGTGTWSPGTGATLAVTAIEASNQNPPSTVSCPAATTGDVWLDLRGTFGYTPSGLTSLTAEGCADLSRGTFAIATAATGTLLPGNPTFQLTGVALTASGSVPAGTFSVTGTAAATLSVPNAGSVANLGAVVSFTNGTILAGVRVSDLSALSPNLAGSGMAYVSSVDVPHFAPADYGLDGGPFPATIPLRSGLNLLYSYQATTLPTAVTTVLSHLNIAPPAGVTILAVAQVGMGGLAASLDVNFGTDDHGAALFATNGSAFFLDDVTLSLSLGTASAVSLSGAAYFEMPAMWSGGAPSRAGVTVSAAVSLSDLSPVISLGLNNWVNAFGVPGLSIADLAGSFAVSENPSVKLSADRVTLPAGWPQAVGLAAGATITMDTNISLTQPLVTFAINPGPNGTALTPLAVGYATQIASGTPLTTTQQQVVDSLKVNSASFYLAPFGGTTASGLTIQRGLAVGFAATVDNVPVTVEGAVGVTPPSLTVDVAVGSYAIGPVTLGAARFQLALSPTSLRFGFSGGFSYGSNSFTGSVNLALGSTANGASVAFTLQAGLPSYLMVNATLTGSVAGDGSGAQVSAAAWGGFLVNGQEFGSIRFVLTLPGGLSWSDVSDSIGTLVWYFQQTGASAQLIMTALQSVGYSSYDVLNALGAASSYGAGLLSTLESTFNPFSTTYYDIWTGTSSGQLLVLDVSNGSQSPNAQVITWSWNNGYNQDWAFVADPYAPGWYEVVNRGSGQCLSDYGNSTQAGTSIVQYPCYGAASQQWYLGNIALNTTYVITNLQSWLVADVQGAYPWAGGTMDQWSYNGGSNQQFWLTNSGN